MMSPHYKLTYFNARGLAEPIRLLFAYAGVQYDDIRFEKEEWVGGFKQATPFGKVPLLEVDGKEVHQSMAICRYLGKQFNLAGDSDWEELEIDVIADTIKDMLSLVHAAAPVIHGGDKDLAAKKKDELANETLPFFYSRFDEIVKKNAGHFVNGKLTWVDLSWTHFSALCKGYHGVDMKGKYPHLDSLEDKVLQLPAIKSWIEKRPVTNH